MAAKRLQRVVESGLLRTFLDSRMARVFRHPMREHLLGCFNEEITSATRIGESLGLEVTDFYKHVQALEELGLIEEVNGDEIPGRRGRGTRERFFRAKEVLLIDAEAAMTMPRTLLNDWHASHLLSIWDEATEAIRAGAFTVGGESHITWLPGVFDAPGWREANAILDEALYRLMEVQKHSTERVVKSGSPGFTATFAMLGFGTPRGAAGA